MTPTVLFWTALIVVFGVAGAFFLGFWCGLRMMHTALEHALKQSVVSKGFFEINGVRFIAVATNPNPPRR